MSYDMIDRFLRNNLGDDDYAEYSAALDALCAQPVASEPRQRDKVWCEYVAGLIGTYIGEPVDSKRVAAISGIIERRLWALERPASEPVAVPQGFVLVPAEANERIKRAIFVMLANADDAGLFYRKLIEMASTSPAPVGIKKEND